MSRDPHFEQMLAQVAWRGALLGSSFAYVVGQLDEAVQKSLPFITSWALCVLA